MNILITLCARGGSKGVPKKNIRKLNKIPLIGYSINTAKKFASNISNTDISLSTESEEIKKVAADLGLTTDYLRPNKFATDEAGKIGVIRDLLFFEEKKRKKKYEYILDLDVSSPLRSLNDLLNAFELIKACNDSLNLFSVSPANRNPYFNMVEIKKNGYFGLIKKGSFKTRQSSPKVYDINGSFYFYKRSFFDLGLESSITNKSMVYEVPHICFDIDNEIDYVFMNYLIQNNKLDFEL